jgi:hypothetical protein
MNRKFIFSVILVCMLVLSLSLAGCKTDSDDGGGGFTVSIDVADGSKGMGSASITSGSPTGNAAGASVTVTATPAKDHHFKRWSNNVAGMGSVSENTAYTFTINADTYLCAVFAPDDNKTGIFNFDGIWVTNIGEEKLEITFNGNAWSHKYASGTITIDGNYGSSYMDGVDDPVAMFVITSPTTITAYMIGINKGEIYYATKKQ